MPMNRLYTWGLRAMVFLTLFFLAANLTSQFFLRGESALVPDVVGKAYQEARTELSKVRVAIELKGMEYSSAFERGRVLSQDPSAGSRIKVFRRVKVVVSKGSELVTVPKITGLSLEAVSQTLLDAGLRKGSVSLVHTPRFPAGRIMLQYPPAESLVFRDSSVNFLASQGELNPKYLMPDLISRHGETVRRALSQMGFRVSISGAAYYPGLEPGIIIRQFPPRGYPLQKMTLITMEVSK
jgi:beta-lactam-binding protein with PASTA domain